jgi:hypothetical protein
MVRPETLSVERERTALKRNPGELFNFGSAFAWIEPSQPPITAILFRAAQDVDRFVNKRVAANLRANGDLAENVALRVEFQNSEIVPLTQVEVLAVITQV